MNFLYFKHQNDIFNSLFDNQLMSFHKNNIFNPKYLNLYIIIYIITKSKPYYNGFIFLKISK